MRDADLQGAAALRAALRDFNHRTDEVVRRHGLTLEQYQLLLLIEVHPRGEATIGHLYKAVHRGQSAVTQLARRMENRGLITRQLSREDARVRYLKLTSQGKKRLGDTVAALGSERSRLLEILKQADGP